MAKVALADGSIEEFERRALLFIAGEAFGEAPSAHGAQSPEGLLQWAIDAADSGEDTVAFSSRLGVTMTHEQRAQTLRLCFALVAGDGELSEAEREGLSAIAAGFSFTQSEFEQVVAEYA